MTDGQHLKGIGVSPGVGVGRAVVMRWALPEVPHRNVPARQVKKEIRRLRAAVNDVCRQLEAIRAKAAGRAGPVEARVFDAQVLMLQDEVFLAEVEELIRDNHLTAEKAYEFKVLELGDLWSKSTSPRLRERLADLHGIAIRLLAHLMGQAEADAWASLQTGEPAVVIAHELSPGLTVQLDLEHVAGLVSEEGTRISHAAILAHSLGIPAVMGLEGALDAIVGDQTVIVDGTAGTVVVRPSDTEIVVAREREAGRRAHQRDFISALDLPSVTRDDVPVILRGNVDLPEELEVARKHGARGIGLVRTEFLVTSRTELPDEDEQTAYFERLARAFPEDPVVIRTYDLGGDKFPAAFRAPPEPNPFLGWRAIRVCLDEPEIFRPQIRAALRAGRLGNVHLMLPLVTEIDEVLQARELVEQEGARLHQRGIDAATSLPIGVMVETPAAVMLAEQLAEVSDFLSVGTNDLTQYTLAVDRGNAHLAPRFNTLAPPLLRMMAMVVDAGRATGVPVSVCGEMASDPVGAYALLGLGYTTLSVSPPALPEIRWLVRSVSAAAAGEAARTAAKARDARTARRAIQDALRQEVDTTRLAAPA